MTTLPYLNIPRIKTLSDFKDYLGTLEVDLPIEDDLVTGANSPLAQAYTLSNGRVIGNRFCIHPMEGWDATTNGKPTDLMTRRWLKFGRSGAKLIWGGRSSCGASRRKGKPKPVDDFRRKYVRDRKTSPRPG